jgi:NAD+ kinase
MQNQVDVAVVIGGDGTMLGAARVLSVMNIPLIGINQGRLGFITDVAQNQFREVLPEMLSGAVEHDFRPLMHARVLRQTSKHISEEIFSALAMNDVVVNRGSAGSMVELRVEVDGHFVANHRADGLIIASPTGSTAYALAAGGPIMVPTLSGWTLVPIAPHTLSNRPLVLADPSQVVTEVVAGKIPHANFDMQSFTDLRIGDKIVVTRAAHSAHFLHPKGWNYFATLRAKLHWNEGSSL